MCGIVGVAGASSKDNDNVLQTLLTLDALRGTDSTGIAAITSFNNVNVVKAIGNPYELFSNKGYDKAVGTMNRAVIGHNRFATQGGVNKANAHPFDFDTIVGVHNGTLTNKWELADSKDFVVDSENLYHHMETKGLEHLMGVMKGAWSLVWWDKNNETLNFLRNKERPMFITWSEDWKSMYWASEAWMLDVATARYGIKRHPIQATDVDKLYAFQIDKDRIIYSAVEEMHPSRAPVFTTPPGTNYVHGQNVLALGGKGVTPKKSALPGKVETVASAGYSGKQNALLEIMALSTDRYGAEFYVCFDKEAPSESIRLYKHRDDSYELNSEIMADIVKCGFSEPETPDWKACTYSKVSRSTVVEVLSTKKPAITVAPSHTEFFLDPKGYKKSAHLWYTDHGVCDCCGGFVDPQQNFRFTMNGEAICHECVGDPETAKLLSFAK